VFHLGVTVGGVKARRMLEGAGLAVEQEAFIDHAPRYLTLRAAEWLTTAGHRATDLAMLRLLRVFERLSATPLSRFTGHYTVWMVAWAKA
jgi:hypothetical protein